MEILGLIPARSQSKKLPHKNIKLLGDKPLLAYSVIQSLESKLITRTIVATDSTEYAEIAQEYGAEVPFLRTEEVSGDLSTDLETFSFMLEELEKKEGYRPDIVVQLRPTSPFRSGAQIDEAIEALLKNEEADSVRSLVLSDYSPFKMWLVDEEGMRPAAECGLKEAYNLPRQKLPKAYIHNGAIDVIRTNTILKKESMTGEKILPYIMDTCFDIDTLDDFIEAEEHLKKS